MNERIYLLLNDEDVPVARGLLITPADGEEIRVKVLDDDIDEIDDCSVILCKKGLTGLTGAALIVRFPSSGELRDHFVDDDGDTSLYEAVKEAGYIRGNCWLIAGDEELFNK